MLAVTECANYDNDNSLLVKGATIIAPSEGVELENQCIWIVDDRIDRVLRCPRNATASRVIEAQESWVVPGLWDMHVHAVWDSSVYRDFFADFVAFGVVGVRDMGGDPDVLLEARRRGLKVVGHLPSELELSEAIDSGMAGSGD